MSLGNVEAGTIVEKELTLKNFSDVPLKIKSVRSTSKIMRIGSVPKELQVGEAAVVVLTVVVPADAKSSINGYILFNAVGHSNNHLRLPVMVKVI